MFPPPLGHSVHHPHSQPAGSVQLARDFSAEKKCPDLTLAGCWDMSTAEVATNAAHSSRRNGIFVRER